MRAVTAWDEKVAVRDYPDPEPGPGQILVGVRAAGLNSADLLQVRGFYPAPPGYPPDILGLEMAGEVIATGPGVTRFTTGDRVMAVVGGGGQAEMAVIHEREAMPVPAGLDWVVAGGLPEVFTTAHDALFTQAGLGAGERLCVSGAAGGVGTAAVQLGVSAGASVTATVRSLSRRDQVASLGATVIDPSELNEAGPFDVILELVGAPNLGANLNALATGGRISVIGTGAGAVGEINLGTLMTRRARIHGSTLRARPLEGKAAAARLVESHVLPLFESGRVTVPVDSTFAIEDAPSAYEHFAAGGKFGKIVLAAG
ncbi:MAG TPA: zinc-binding dehydrogenase [Acidimicrobiales bacterium]|nr:zinc-binding dehydrogenase [Acidimicrobiales bacterium]